MVQSPFVWGKGGAKLTPEEIARQRELEDRLVQQGVDTSPVGHWTQGLARVANALAGSVRRGQLENAANENAAYNSAQTKSWFGGSDFPVAPAAQGQIAATNPATAPVAGQEMALADPKRGGTFDPVQEVMDAKGAPAADWLQYSNGGATRSQPLSPQLVKALGFLPELGVSAQVFSGGQPTATEGGARTGSTRHDHGNAADVFFTKDGRRLDWANPEDQPIFAQIVQRAKANGVTGFGAGDGYMQPGSMHIGFGNPGVWGAGGKGANAAQWLRNAYASAGEMSPASAAIDAQAPLPTPVNVSTPQAQPVNERQMLAQAIRARGGNPQAGILPVIAGEQGQTGMASSGPNMQTLMGAMADPRLSEGNRRIAEVLIRQQMEQQQAARELAARQAERQANWAREDSRTAVLDRRYDDEQAYGRQKDERAYKFDREKWEAERGKGVVVNGRLVNPNNGDVIYSPQGGNFDDVSGLRKEIQQLPSYKNLSQAGPIYKAMADTAGRNSKASDLNLVYGLGKIMDPNSVVREGEMVMVKNTASIPDWLQGAIAQINGGAALTPETRQAIMKEAYGRVQGYKGSFDQDMGMYGGIVQRNGMNPADVIPSFESFEEWKAPEAATVNGPARIKTVDEYNNLPSGAQYIVPQGRLKTKQ